MTKYAQRGTNDRRLQVLDEARACGRMGSRRLSDTVLFGNGSDPTQSLITDALDAFEQGRKERANGLGER